MQLFIVTQLKPQSIEEGCRDLTCSEDGTSIDMCSPQLA